MAPNSKEYISKWQMDKKTGSTKNNFNKYTILFDTKEKYLNQRQEISLENLFILKN